jgi:hypothetical protein
MGKLVIRFAAGAMLMAGASLPAPVRALPIVAADGLRATFDSGTVIEKAQYIRGGRRYCWYDDGWNSAGWYRCGYAWRRGQGWGGYHGWNDWDRPGPDGWRYYGGRHHYYGGPHHWGRGCCW